MPRNITITIERIGPNWWRVGEIEDGEFIRAMYEIPVGNLEDYLDAIADTPVEQKWIATNRPGDQAAIYAEETGVDYATALVHCNMD